MDDIDAELGRPATGQHSGSEDEEQHGERIVRPNLPIKTQSNKKRCYESGFHETTRVCLRKICDCLFQMQWQEAVEYMKSYFQTLEDTSVAKQLLASEIIWRLGTEILHHHPKTKPEDFNSFFERMKNTGVKIYLKVCLEQSFHLLVNGHFEDAKRQLSVAESWRFGQQSASQTQRIKLIHAYRGFLDYFTWCAKRSALSGADYSNEAASQEMHSYFRQASVNLQEILKHPGVWDPFVISYVNMLEFYNDQDGALDVLNEYAYNNSFPPNPNAHVYLYQYLKKHQAPQKKLFKVLRTLQALVPSHELMLEFCSLLLQSGKEKHLHEALSVIFSLLDYSSWKDNLKAWSCLGDIMKELKRKKLKHLVDEEWETRKSWWPVFQFRSHRVRKDFEQNEELVKVKSTIAAALAGQNCMYCRNKRVLFQEKAKAQRLKALQSQRGRRSHKRRR
ncbi:TATA box-binding protein-associated factor RNA polymerase I subunit A [Megalops cyprinoides]|uniref:TATA box-binding protein-associated factor RNA polymerase I subunit A n=1 Tax=Megalops cyprinoides TaxID=118141 RepID=UPI0018656832|nr:TATA box-binding protein-associated factor RNA polymerase I subunit A [Megalops cyprinoides]